MSTEVFRHYLNIVETAAQPAGLEKGTEPRYQAALYVDEFGDGDHWYVKGSPDTIKRFVQLANSLEDEAVKGTDYEPGVGGMAKIHKQLGDDTVPNWKIVSADNLEQLEPIDDKTLEELTQPDLSAGAQEFMSDFLWRLESDGQAVVHSDSEKGVAEAGPFSYGARKPRKGSVADLADRKRREQERGKPPIEPRDQMIGTAKVTKGVAEGIPGKKTPKPDRFHIAGSLASYPDKESAIKDRDAKYPGAKVHQVGSRGKIKGEFEEGVAEGTKALVDYIAESERAYNQPVPGDYFAINIREETLFETWVCSETPDGIVIYADDQGLALLERYGYLGEAISEGHDFEIDSDEDSVDVVDQGEYDQEGDMAKDDLATIVRAARRLTGMLDDNDNLPEWVQAKITKAADYVDTAADYIESNREQGVAEGDMAEAKYQGREVKLGKPFLTPGGPKKRSVYVRNPKTGNIKKVNFGDPNMKIKKNIPGRRKNFRARHNCDNPGPRHKARYWSCRAW